MFFHNKPFLYLNVAILFRFNHIEDKNINISYSYYLVYRHAYQDNDPGL